MNTNLLLKQDLTVGQLAMVESEFKKKAKSKGIAYTLWFFLGLIGGHRFYSRDIGIAIGQLLTFGGLGIWSLLDVFFIGKRIETINDQTEAELIGWVKATHKSEEKESKETLNQVTTTTRNYYGNIEK